MNNKTIISEEGDSCLEFKKVADYYLITILGFIGFVLNLLCSIAFYKSKIHKTSDSIMFKYYFIKIILDTIIFFLRCFNPIFENSMARKIHLERKRKIQFEKMASKKVLSLIRQKNLYPQL